jgi:hypothetical protein
MVDPYWVTADEASHLSLKAAYGTRQPGRGLLNARRVAASPCSCPPGRSEAANHDFS